MSAFPLMIEAPSASISRRRSIAPAGSGPLRARSPATATRSGFSVRMALRTAARATALPWTSDRTIARVIELPRGLSGRCSARRSRARMRAHLKVREHPRGGDNAAKRSHDGSPGSSQHTLIRDDEGERRFAGRLAINRGDAPAPPEPSAELVHRDLEPERVARHHDALEA